MPRLFMSFLSNEEEGIGSYPSEVFCTFWYPLVEEEGWAWSMMMLQLCENVYQANRQMWAIDSDFVCKAAEGRPSSSSYRREPRLKPD